MIYIDDREGVLISNIRKTNIPFSQGRSKLAQITISFIDDKQYFINRSSWRDALELSKTRKFLNQQIECFNNSKASNPNSENYLFMEGVFDILKNNGAIKNEFNKMMEEINELTNMGVILVKSNSIITTMEKVIELSKTKLNIIKFQLIPNTTVPSGINNSIINHPIFDKKSIVEVKQEEKSIVEEKQEEVEYNSIDSELDDIISCINDTIQVIVEDSKSENTIVEELDDDIPIAASSSDVFEPTDMPISVPIKESVSIPTSIPIKKPVDVHLLKKLWFCLTDTNLVYDALVRTASLNNLSTISLDILKNLKIAKIKKFGIKRAIQLKKEIEENSKQVKILSLLDNINEELARFLLMKCNFNDLVKNIENLELIEFNGELLKNKLDGLYLLDAHF